ncbi:hypothetical protein KHS38_17250 [Mucilaginibacter sp. Bleaf8]|uniref:hypothetical protein n=1 Tax=Mucilaginibacter sp. Bleaf8 TaxID=2834430 RepID=UPI001BD1522B|nr:hypothetical protein [Mucilaginibacter sp. Bleaf8]MBS7566159.1 hypothetical protein [Mucilaginibacter sp. Bleaf8]
MKNRFLSCLYIFLALAALVSCKSRTHDVWVEGWDSNPVPETREDVAQYASGKNLQVYLRHDSVLVKGKPDSTQQPLPFAINAANDDDAWQFGGDRLVAAVSDGYLVGFNKGEWGGHLYWFSKDGSQHYEISDHQVVQFLQKGNEVYAIEGLSHMSTSEGSVIRLTQNKGKWVAQAYAKLPYAPVAAVLDRTQNFLIITSSSLVQVNQQAKVRTLVVNTLLRYMPSANSLVLKGDDAYVGMRKGVFKYNLQTGEQAWLLNNKLHLE